MDRPGGAPGRLHEHVQALAGSIGERHLGRPAALREAAAYIEGALAAAGLSASSQEFRAGGQAVRNLDAELGSGPGPVVIVGAHYDTVPGSPGADDNASGVAATLEIARMLAGSAPRVRCAFFVNEEPPWFQTEDMGSLHYARRARQRGEPIAAMLSLECIGYYAAGRGTQRYPAPLGLAFPDAGNFVALVSDRRSRALLRRVERGFRARAAFPVVAAALPGWVPGVSWSDQWAFWQQGYPALMVTDTAPFRNPAYHTAADVPADLDYVALATVTAALAGVAADLAAE
jgi:Zn-dependent M28 family amino/carboxypeptidase